MGAIAGLVFLRITTVMAALLLNVWSKYRRTY